MYVYKKNYISYLMNILGPDTYRPPKSRLFPFNTIHTTFTERVFLYLGSYLSPKILIINLPTSTCVSIYNLKK